MESDPDLSDGFCDLLRAEGYTALPATSRQNVLRYFDEPEPPSLILLDCAPPCEIEVGFIRELRDHSPAVCRVPIVVLFSDAWVRRKFDSREVTEFVRKPLNLDHFLVLIERLCS